MLKIGLTGGIGSGKSTVAHIFEVLGIPVYYADDAAKKLMNEDDDVKAFVIKAFGKDAYKDDVLDRTFLADQVFINEEKIQKLNSIVHPATIKDAAIWFEKQTSPYVIKEAALIFESGSNTNLDYVVGVQSPQHLKIQRAMNRDNISNEQVQARMSKQMDEDAKMRLCDYVIINDEKEMLLPQVLELHERFWNLQKQ